ncbi:MAG: hypothetical protein H7Z17_16985 [Fuerstia sp.]|nr:hypothetical protein [Fuerstiella sp.]
MTQDKTNSSPPTLDDVQWSAMQYVLGELSDEQTELFESAMADDVALCEAVLAATQLTCGIALACESQPSTRPVIASVTLIAAPVAHSRPAFARFGVFAAAASLVLALLAMVTLQTRQSGGDLAAVDDATADALAILLNDGEASEMNTDLDELTGSDDSLASLVAPEWLLTAVDLDAAAASASENHPVIGPDDEAGVY